MYNLLRPKAIHLILFAVGLLPFIYFFIANSFFSLFGMGGIADLFVLGFVVLLVTIIVDLKYKTKLIRYALVGIILTIIMFIAAIPYSKYHQQKTEKLGLALSDRIYAYKKAHGHYPENLDDTFFLKTEKNTASGYPFRYEKRYNEQGEEYFELIFYGLGGMEGHLYSDATKWIYVD